MSGLILRAKQFRDIGPLLVALMPALVALTCSALGPRASVAEAPAARSPLAFHQYHVNLGKVAPKRDHFARFAFTNRSSVPIKLRKLETSCGCLTQHAEKKIFQPGEQGEFFLRIQSANQEPGPKSYLCKAYYGPVDQPEIEHTTDLRFDVALPQLTVVVRPRVLVFHQPNDKVTKHEVAVTDLRGKPLTILSASCDADFVDVKIIPAAELELVERDEGVVGKIAVSVGKVPAGRHECEVKVRTDDQEFNLLRIPVRVLGPEMKGTRTAPRFEPTDASDDDPTQEGSR